MRKFAWAAVSVAFAIAFASCVTLDEAEYYARTPGFAPHSLAVAALKATESGYGLDGFSVAASDDGRYLVIGSPGLGMADKGKPAWGMWMLWGRTADGKGYDALRFGSAFTVKGFSGYSVAISGDGSVIAVGSPGFGADSMGSVAIYVMPEGGWTQSDEPLEPAWDLSFGAKADSFGISVAMDKDANVILCGLPNYEGVGRAVYFLKPATGWGDKKVKGIDSGYLGQGGLNPGAAWGYSVAISADSNWIAIGAPAYAYRGMVTLFKKPAGGWQKTRDLMPISFDSLPEGSMFGSRLSFSGDGGLLAVGAPGFGKSGACFLIAPTWEDGDAKVDYDTIEVSEEEFAFGTSVALSRDGRRLVVGAIGKELSGTVYAFEGDPRDTGSFEFMGRLDDGENIGGMLGFAAVLTANGELLIIGQPRRDNYKGGWKFINFPE